MTLTKMTSYDTSAAFEGCLQSDGCHGGLVHAESASTVIMLDVDATESESPAGNGGVVHVLSGSSLTMTDIHTLNITAGGYGGVVAVNQVSTGSITNVVAAEISAGFGGGFLAALGGCTATMTGINVTNAVGGILNNIGGGGFVVSVIGSSVTLSNVNAVGVKSFAEPGGGFAFIYQAAASMASVNVFDTFSASTAGFLTCQQSTVSLTDLNVTNSTGRDGGLAFLTGCTGVEMTNVNTRYVMASRHGGLVHATGSSFALTDVHAAHTSAGTVSSFFKTNLNTADEDTGGNGGLVSSKGSFVTMTRVVAESTVAAKNGGLLNLDGESQVQASEIEATLTSAGIDGGLMYIAGESTFQVNNMKAMNTVAGREGGLIMATKYATVDASDVVLEQTKAGLDGGLVHASDGVTINMDSVVALRTSADRDGGFIYASGGCIVKMGGVVATTTSAGQNGGLIDAGEGCTVEIADSIVTDTSAGKHGGLVHIPDGAALVRLTNVTGKTVTAATSAGLSLLGKQAGLVLQSSQFLDVSAASAPIAVMDSGAQFQTLHVAIGVTCEASGASTAYIVNNGTGGLALRDLQIDDACAVSSAASTDLMPQGALMCSQETYKDAISGGQVPICGPATVCADIFLTRGSSAIGCACASGALRSLATVSFEDAPYLAGDFCECDAGSFPSDGGGPCQKCPIGTFKSETGPGSCLSCGQDRTTLDVGAVSRTECVCEKLFLLDSEGECTQCVTITDGAICEVPNMTINSLMLKPEYWRISSTSLDVRKCRGETATTPCAGGGAASCAEHHGGPKVLVCTNLTLASTLPQTLTLTITLTTDPDPDPNQCEVCTTEMYYFDKEEAACTKCPDGATPLIISIVGLFVVICALSLLRFLFTTASVHFKRVGAAAKIIVTDCPSNLGPTDLQTG